MPETRFDCLLITRPQAEAEELAGRLADLDVRIVIQPAFQFAAVKLVVGDIQDLQRAVQSEPQAGQPPLLIFTSTRAVEFGLPQLPSTILQACRLAAIGPATAAALQQAGLDAILQPDTGYTSEDLLSSLSAAGSLPTKVWIIAAAGGRKALLQSLRQNGGYARELYVYERWPVEVATANDEQLQQSSRILSVWTSANAMQRLASGLSHAAWQRVCAGTWLVVSPRLAEIAAELGAEEAHISDAPGNAELADWVRKLCRSP